jgi:hypothetical protein
VTETEIRQQSILAFRTLAMNAVQKANSGHPGAAIALATIAYLLYTKHLRHNPSNPDWPNRDIRLPVESDRLYLSVPLIGMVRQPALTGAIVPVQEVARQAVPTIAAFLTFSCTFSFEIR